MSPLELAIQKPSRVPFYIRFIASITKAISIFRWRRLFREPERSGGSGRFVPAVVEGAPGYEVGAARMPPPSEGVVPKRPGRGGAMRMEHEADYGFGLAALLKEVLGTSAEIAFSPEAVAIVRPTSAVGDTLSATPTLLRVALVSPCFGASSLACSTVAHLCYPSDLAAEVADRPALAHTAGSATRTLLEDNTDMVRGGALKTAPETYCRRSPAGGTIATRKPRTSHGSLCRPTLVNSSLFPCRPEYHSANRPAGIPSPGSSASALRSS